MTDSDNDADADDADDTGVGGEEGGHLRGDYQPGTCGLHCGDQLLLNQCTCPPTDIPIYQQYVGFVSRNICTKMYEGIFIVYH